MAQSKVLSEARLARVLTRLSRAQQIVTERAAVVSKMLYCTKRKAEIEQAYNEEVCAAEEVLNKSIAEATRTSDKNVDAAKTKRDKMLANLDKTLTLLSAQYRSQGLPPTDAEESEATDNESVVSRGPSEFDEQRSLASRYPEPESDDEMAAVAARVERPPTPSPAKSRRLNTGGKSTVGPRTARTRLDTTNEAAK